MTTISPKAPLRVDESFGYAMNENYRDVVKQNFKMLLLTSPGERVMIPNFGVGIRNFLFEMPGVGLQGKIKTKITEQVGLFLSYLDIEEVLFNDMEETLFVTIKYFITPLALSDNIEIEVKI